MVVVFMTLFLSALCLAQQRLATSLRLEKIQAQRLTRDQGSVLAMAKVLTLLETGIPPTSPFLCKVPVDTPTGTRNFTVTLTLDGIDKWKVKVAPSKSSDGGLPLPATFSAVTSVLN
jgi:hypothetical protein